MSKFIPKDGERYYAIEVQSTTASIELGIRDERDNASWFKTNCFKTKKEAEKALKQIKTILTNE